MALAALGLVSVILICAAAPTIGDGKNWQGQAVFALIVGIFTFVAVLAFVIAEHRSVLGASKNNLLARLLTLSFFGFLWVIMASCTTFGGPFHATGNGYFGARPAEATCPRAERR